MTCPSCQQQTTAGKFCQECGSRLPPPSTGGNSGDIVATRSTVIAGSTVIVSDALAALSQPMKCPICGKRNNPVDTFECAKCGREHVCVTHQDSESYWCKDCVAQARRENEERERLATEAKSREEQERRHLAAQEETRKDQDHKLREMLAFMFARQGFRVFSGDHVAVHLAPEIDVEFVRVAAGEFLFGQYKKKRRTDAFWIGKAPVTTAQFLAFIGDTGYKTACAYYASKVAQQQLNHPAELVSWDDAQAWCAWASAKAKAEICLPSEVEWEKAARGADGRAYPWGAAEPTPRHANFGNQNAWRVASYEDRWKFTTSVGQFSPTGDSPYGLTDSAGNVWEWCAEWYDAEETQRVLRGGSFFDDALNTRCTCRNRGNPSVHLVSCGFRVILRPPSFG